MHSYWALERKYRYIIRMGSDDLARPGRIDRLIGFMNAHPDIEVAGAQTKRISGMCSRISAKATFP